MLHLFNSTRTTGVIGLIAALLTGIGEFLLHYDPLARFSGDISYAFFIDISVQRLSAGHLIAVLALPLYLVGCWHIFLMLKPGNAKFAFLTFLIGSYGFVIGGVWMGSRALLAMIVQNTDPSGSVLINYYDEHYESLLTIIRITTLFLSLSIVWLILTTKTRFPRWLAAVNPISVLLGCFGIFFVIPSIGKFIMPIALNVAFFTFFLCSIVFGNHNKELSEKRE